MLKILETLALVFLKQALNGPHEQKQAPLDANYYANKGKIIVLFFILAIIFSILIAFGILLVMVGTSLWLNDRTQNLSLYLIYSGATLTLCSAGVVALTLLWKKQSATNPKLPTELPAPASESQSASSPG